MSDVKPGTRYGVAHNIRNVEDHINMHNVLGAGTGANRVEIAYNRLRGGSPTSTSGSGIMAGDGANGRDVYIHHNTIVNVRNVAIGVAGGQNITVDSNRILMEATANPINVAMYTSNYGQSACTGHIFSNNRVRISNNNNLYINGLNCTNITNTGNVFGDTSLTESMFDVEPAQCGALAAQPAADATDVPAELKGTN